MSTLLNSITNGTLPVSNIVAQSISHYLDDTMYRIGVERAVVKSTGMFSPHLVKDVYSWKDIYYEFEAYNFDPTQVLIHTNSIECIEVALLFDSCDCDTALSIAVESSYYHVASAILTSGRATIPTASDLLMCISNKDSTMLELLSKDGSIDVGAIHLALMTCVDTRNIPCLLALLDNSTYTQFTLLQCIRSAILSRRPEVVVILLEYLQKPSYDLMELAVDIGNYEIVKVLTTMMNNAEVFSKTT